MLKKLIPLDSLTLKTKITGVVLILFLFSIWVLTLFISKRLEYAMTSQLEEQQFSTASYIADSIESDFKLRINSLMAIADRITPELIANPGKLRDFLRDKPLLAKLFQTGCVVISREGIGIADYPVLQGQVGASYAELEYFREVVATGKPVVGKPRIGRFAQKPVVGFAVPVLAPSGKVIAVLAGYTLLSDQALFGSIENFAYKDFPDRLVLVSPKYHIFVSGSDPTRIMTQTPKTGVNPLFDRFMSGFEGSGVSVNSRGIKLLESAKQIPTPGWFVRVGLPSEVAFAPIRSMKNWSYFTALGLSLLSSLLVWLVIRHALRPLYDASTLIQNITAQRLPPQNINITRHDEIGQMLSNFNVHLNYRRQAEEALLKSEAKFKAMVETLPLAIYLHVEMEQICEYLNPMFIKLFGYTLEEIPTVSQWWSLAYPDETYRRQISEEWTTRVKYAIEMQSPIEPMESLVTCKDGSKKNILWGYITMGDKNYAYGLDITARKRIEHVLQKAHDELERRVQERTSELAEANKELEDQIEHRKKAEGELISNQDQLRNLYLNLQSAREEERASIAREIHDELGQIMTAVKMDIAWIQGHYAEHKDIFEKTSATLKLIDMTIKSIKKICTELRPAILDHLGLGTAIQWQAQEFQNRAGISCEVVVEESLEVSSAQATALFRIFQEALTNVLRHANATRVTASLKGEFGKIELKISDNGKGITEDDISKPNSFGLLGMRERVYPWRGNVSISSIPGEGTRIDVILPQE
jgi:PAS domain S-box-containing protein